MIITTVAYWVLSRLILGKNCRCLSSDPCWPSNSDFKSLASKLSRPLLYPIPPEAACYPVSNPSGDCTTVRSYATDGIWRATQPGSMQAPNFETFTFPNGTLDACYLNTTIGTPCNQGSIPIVGVDASTIEDVQAAVKFATKHNLRVVVKGTGHDYLGRSTARGAFLIWTHNFKAIIYNDAFVPKGAPNTETYQAMTLGAGVQWRDAYDAVNAHGRVLVGGACDTVGAAGGWVLGGGHSTLSTAYGLGVDNVIEFSVVTAKGHFLIANSYSHPDLFWALRGGGGGTYGIVISATYKTHESTPLIAQLMVATSTNHTTYATLAQEFIRISPSLSDAGWAGTISLIPDTFSSITIAPLVPGVQPNASWDEFFSFAKDLTSKGLQITTATTFPVDSWHTWYKQILPPFLTGINFEMGSRLLPKDLVLNNYETVAASLAEINVGYLLVAGGAVAKVNPDSMGLNPAWRQAIAHVITATTWPEGTPEDVIDDIRTKLKRDIQVISRLAPGAGSYLNEASLYESDPQNTFFGSHYKKLRDIKRSYDPSDLFVVAGGVGSEEWDKDLNCRL